MIKFKDIPSHIRYPGMIIGFLSMSVIGQMIVLNRALDGVGLQVEENYYDKAVKWDGERLERVRWTKQMGKISLDVVKKASADTRVHLFIPKAPNNMAATKVVGFRPAIAKAQHQTTIKATPGASTKWYFDIPKTAQGVWDFEITWKHTDGSFTTKHRVKL